MNSPLITPELVQLDADLGNAPPDVIARLAAMVVNAGRATDAAPIADAATAREEKAGTGVNGRVAIPHCRSAAVPEPTLALSLIHI